MHASLYPIELKLIYILLQTNCSEAFQCMDVVKDASRRNLVTSESSWELSLIIKKLHTNTYLHFYMCVLNTYLLVCFTSNLKC